MWLKTLTRPQWLPRCNAQRLNVFNSTAVSTEEAFWSRGETSQRTQSAVALVLELLDYFTVLSLTACLFKTRDIWKRVGLLGQGCFSSTNNACVCVCVCVYANDFAAINTIRKSEMTWKHLIIEQRVAGGLSDGGADSGLLQLQNNDAPKETVGSQRGRSVYAEPGILKMTSEAQWH